MDKWERNRRRREKDRRRENRLAIILALPIVALMAILMFFTIGDEWKRQEKEAVKQESEPIVIENPDPCNTGSILIYANGGVYSFYGEFDIENDGKDGEEVEMTLEGYMVAGYPHGEPETQEIYGP